MLLYLNFFKSLFDFSSALVLLLFISPLILAITVILCILYLGNPFFFQKRIGLNGKKFTIFKFKTMNMNGDISSFSRFLRKFKLDELPQLFNILKGDMSVVGPRPDIPGYYDKLVGNDRLLLKLKPGLTGYASINFFNEEYLLNTVENPEEYNDKVIFPKKVELNLWYLENISFLLDLKIIFKTVILPFKNK